MDYILLLFRSELTLTVTWLIIRLLFQLKILLCYIICEFFPLQIAHPNMIDALVVINGVAKQAGWTEWGYQKVMLSLGEGKVTHWIYILGGWAQGLQPNMSICRYRLKSYHFFILLAVENQYPFQLKKEKFFLHFKYEWF